MDYLDETISTYDSKASLYELRSSKMLISHEIDLFFSLLQGPHILDAGCGTGRDARYFLQRNLLVTAIDLSREMLARTHRNAPQADAVRGDMRKLPFLNSVFSGIWCCAALTHLRDADLSIALSEFNRVLCQQGVLFLSVREGEGEEQVLEPELEGAQRLTVFYREANVHAHLCQQSFKILNSYFWNEKNSLGNKHRDVNFIFVFARKR